MAYVPGSGKWRTTFKHNKDRYCLGTFGTGEEAARVWDLAAIKYRGATCRSLNFDISRYEKEIGLLQHRTFEETLHVLNIRSLDAPRTGRAVKRKLDTALQATEPAAAAAEDPADDRDGSISPPELSLKRKSGLLMHSSAGILRPASPTAPSTAQPPCNPFVRRNRTCKRTPRASSQPACGVGMDAEPTSPAPHGPASMPYPIAAMPTDTGAAQQQQATRMDTHWTPSDACGMDTSAIADRGLNGR